MARGHLLVPGRPAAKVVGRPICALIEFLTEELCEPGERLTMTDNQPAVIVTGGAYGIGRGICRLFAARQWRVIIADIHEARGRALQQELRGSLFIPTD